MKEHTNFLAEIGVNYYAEVFQRMSRDFLIRFKDDSDALRAQDLLGSLKSASDGINIFSIDNRGDSLFLELTYPQDISTGFSINGEVSIDDFGRYVAFVAIKNGEHHGVGYFIDTKTNELPEKFPLTKVFEHIIGTI